ncbi:MAG: ABC transporter ATP-binding protein/permease [bacterium]
MPPIIEIKNLNKSFTSYNYFGFKTEITTALSGINLDIEEGRCYGLLGPNGAGKTTLLKIISTLILPDNGTVAVKGHELNKHDEKIKSLIGLVANEERSFYWRLTGIQNLEFFAGLYGLNKKESGARIKDLFDLFKIDYGERRFDSYSAGMKRKMAFVRALIHNPQILLLDEPMENLDYNSVEEMKKYVKILINNGKTIILATHHLHEAGELCDLFIVIHKGRICGSGTKSELGTRANCSGKNLADIYLELTKNVYPVRENRQLQADNSSKATSTQLETEHNKSDSVKENFSDKSNEYFLKELTQTVKGRSSLTGLREVYSLIKKDFLLETSYKLNFLMNVFTTGITLLTYFFIDRLFGHRITPYMEEFGVNYFSYVLLSMAFFNFIGTGIGSFSYQIRNEQMQGTLESLLVTPANIYVIILGMGLWNFIFAVLDVLIYFLSGQFLFRIDFSNINIFSSLVVLVLTVISFSCLGIISASFIMVFKRGNPAGWLLNTLEGLVGGVYFPVNVMPQFLQNLANLFPVTYAIKAMELSVYKGYPLYRIQKECAILLIFSVFLVPLAKFSFRYALDTARKQGSLIQY